MDERRQACLKTRLLYYGVKVSCRRDLSRNALRLGHTTSTGASRWKYGVATVRSAGGKETRESSMCKISTVARFQFKRPRLVDAMTLLHCKRGKTGRVSE